MTDQQKQIVRELLDDVKELRVMIIRLENQVAKNETVIAEIVMEEYREPVTIESKRLAQILAGPGPKEMDDFGKRNSTPVPTSDASEFYAKHYNAITITAPTVISMAREVIPSLKVPFWYSDLKDACLKRWPQYAQKIRNGIHPACKELVDKGELVKGNGGFFIGGKK